MAQVGAGELEQLSSEAVLSLVVQVGAGKLISLVEVQGSWKRRSHWHRIRDCYLSPPSGGGISLSGC